MVLNGNPGVGAWPAPLHNSPDTQLPSSLFTVRPPHGHLGRLHLRSVWANAGETTTHAQCSTRCGPVLPGTAVLHHRRKNSWDSFLPVLRTMEILSSRSTAQPAATLAAQPIYGFLAASWSTQRPGWDVSISSALCPSVWSRADWDAGTVFQLVDTMISLRAALVWASSSDRSFSRESGLAVERKCQTVSYRCRTRCTN